MVKDISGMQNQASILLADLPWTTQNYQYCMMCKLNSLILKSIALSLSRVEVKEDERFAPQRDLPSVFQDEQLNYFK